MAVSSEKMAWLVGLGILPAGPGGAMAGDEAPGAAAPMRRRSQPAGAAEQSSSADEAAGTEQDSQSSEEAGYEEDHSYSGSFTQPPPAPPPPPRPAPRTAPSPPPPAPAAEDEPNMTPMDGDRPPGPWADLMDGPNVTPSREPNRSGGEAPEPVALANGTPGVTEQFEFTVESPTTKAWGGKIEIVWKLTFQAAAAFLPNEDTQIQLTYNNKEGILKKAATSWPLEKVMKALGAPSVLNKSKFTLEGEMSDKGVTIKAGFGLETPFGSGEVSGVLVKIEHGKTPAFGAVEIAYTTPKIVLGDWVEENVQVAQASLSLKGAASIEPQWVRLMAEELIKDAGIETAATATTAAGGGGAAAVLEAAIPAALAAVAVGTAVGVANMFVQKANMDKLKSSLAAAIRDLRGGLYDGTSGAVASGSGDLYAQGYALGSQAYQKAVDTFVAALDRPPLPDESGEVRRAATKAVMNWSGLAQIEDTLRWGFFSRWVEENHGLGTFKGDAQEAVLWCFGVPREPSSGPHMKLWVAKSALPDALKS